MDNPQGSVPLSEEHIAAIEAVAKKYDGVSGWVALQLIATIRHQQAQLEQARAEREHMREIVRAVLLAERAIYRSIKLRYGTEDELLLQAIIDAIHGKREAASPSQESAEGVQE